ncbi:2-keto-3-deoxygluconate permease, partial [Klebsiella pneumoniae]|uniref:2-keto-3-deoxygluconate permease n=1 Tax=Klebsiella pneumoniae TaxID=573 RepID=UPI003EE2A413
FTAGLSGILLGIISALTGIVFYFIYNLFLKKKSALGAALGTTGCAMAIFSSSTVEIHSPPDLIISFARSLIAR